jgi:hypothetical protein
MERRLKNLIYGLIDPQTLFIRYIGQSSSGLSRPQSHLRYGSHVPKTHCGRWIRALQRIGTNADLCVLQICEQRVDLDLAEIWWISFGRACGWPLINHTAGGNSGERTEESRALISQRTRESWQDPDIRAARVESLSVPRGPMSDEHRDKIAVRNLGREVSSDTRDKIAASLLGHGVSAETRKKISETLKRRWKEQNS